MSSTETVHRSICRMCHGGCAALLTVCDGRLTRVRPDPASPFSLGQLCIKAIATPDVMYYPNRLLTPLKREGERGSGRWQKIGWEQALSEIAGRLDDIRKESGPEAIALGQGTGRHHYLHVVRFANQLGTPNWYEPGLANCFIPRITVSNLTYGGFVAADYYGKVPPRTIIFWGHNPVVSSADGELMFPVRRALQNGSYGIAIDPRRSETARLCKQWLPIRPGADAALALAMVHVIIYHNYYDAPFVEQWTTGFDALKEHVKDFTPAWAAPITGIPEADIVDVARRYATEKPSVLEWGVAIEQNPNCLQTVRALALLRGLTGNLDIPGGDLLGSDIIKPYPVLRNVLPRGALEKRIGAKEFKLLGGFRAFMPSAHIPSLFRAMRTGDPYRVRALMLFGNNPLLTVANSHDVHASLQKLDLLVATELTMTPSAALADYVLPAAMWPEVNQITELPYVTGEAVFAQQKVVQVGECRQDEEIINDLARRLGLPQAEESLEDVINQRLQPLGMDFARLKEQFFVFPEHRYRKYEEKGFRTPSGKVELYCNALQKIGYDPLPTFREPPESPVSTPELLRQFPHVLTTGARRVEFFHSENRHVEFLRKRRPDPLAELHPTVAAAHGIAEGDWIIVSSPRGRIRMKAHVTENIGENTVSIDHGWWFPERGGPDYGMFESNANVLTSNEPPYDPAFGSYQMRGLLCRVEKESTGGEP